MSKSENGQRARDAVLDLAPAGSLDAPTKRALRATKTCGSEGSARKLSRRVAPFREALVGLAPAEAALGLDTCRDLLTAALLADGIGELMQDSDVRGPLWRRLFDAYCRLMRIKAERREELREVLAKVTVGDDPIAALTGGQT